MTSQYSIRDLSQEFDVTTRTLRFYEEKGLLSPARVGQNRIYSTADRARLILILRGKILGLSLEQSADLISMYDPKSNNKKQIEALIEKIQSRRLQLDQQKQALEHMIVDLDEWEQRSRTALTSSSNHNSTFSSTLSSSTSSTRQKSKGRIS
ncbi:MAG: DNA-binding transcriptional MerR regulator [Candidatus Azotimanducaceae bacterium]|jgi:DNA-binding transcriptional MerR regulator